jgi:hypothetical protein
MSTGLYHWTERQLNPGDRVEPGRWGRIVKSTGPKHPLFYREMLLELVRGLEHGTLPSRLSSAYVWVDLDHARAARHEPANTLYEVGLAEPTLRLFDETWIARMRTSAGMDALVQAAREYWSGKVLNPHRREGLTPGALVVVRLVEGPQVGRRVDDA